MMIQGFACRHHLHHHLHVEGNEVLNCCSVLGQAGTRGSRSAWFLGTLAVRKKATS